MAKTTITQFPFQREKLGITMPSSGTCTVAHGQWGRAAFAVAQTAPGAGEGSSGYRCVVNAGPFVRVYGPPNTVFDLTTLHVPSLTDDPAPVDDETLVAAKVVKGRKTTGRRKQ